MSETNSRDEIFAHIRAGLKRGALDDATRKRLALRLDDPPSGTVPKRGQGDLDHRVRTFIAQAERVHTSIARVAEEGDAPAAVQGALKSRGFPLNLRAARDPLVARLDWSRAPGLALAQGPAGSTDRASLVGAFAGIAETGTLLLYSAPETPSSLNFAPEMHIVLLKAARILASYEEAFDALKAARPGGNVRLPRTVNLITGPSRTADVERTLTLGAHGPRFLHVIVIDAD
jgi:L-lactate dehydrogenase complex protein LldG